MEKNYENALGARFYSPALKLLLTMKLILILICGLGLLSSLAEDGYAQATKLTFAFEDASIKEVLLYIENHSEFAFMYDNNEVDVNRKVNIKVKDEKIDVILTQLFGNGQINTRTMGRHIIIFPAASHTARALASEQQQQQQQNQVSGTVTDDTGQPLPGVAVVVKGTTQGTVTNADGQYTISNIPENATLQFSFVGMRAQEVVVGNQTTINIEMVADAIGIEEVVAVGYGTQKKVNLTGAVDVISNEKLVNRSAPTVSQLLQGVSPGLNLEINNQDGFQPGATMDISIRGVGSLNGGEPYVIVDGFPGNINNLNPEDIESITILKDAAASAIYGARAPYGVILVTTKNGEKDKKLSVTYSGNVFVNTPQPLPESLDSYTWVRMQNEAARNLGGQPFTNQTVDRIIAYQNEDWDYLRQSMDWPEGATIFGSLPQGDLWNNGNLNYANTDWWDVMYGHSVNQKHDLNFQGGSQHASYYFSAGYLSQEGVLNYGTDKFERISTLGKFNLNITDWWDFGWEMRATINLRNKPNYTNIGDYSQIFREISREYPITPLYDGYGNYHSESHIPGILQGGADLSKETDHWNNFKMEIRPTQGWKVNADFAYNSFSALNSLENKSVYWYDVHNQPYITGQSIPTSIERIHRDNYYWTTNIYSSYNFEIKDNHQFLIMAGMQLEKRKNSRLSGYKEDLIVDDVLSLETATGSPILSESLPHSATQGYFSRFTYNFKEKYLVESNVRYDGSYVFRKGNRWGFYPSFSLGWNIHKESFWNIPENYISSLKLRGSWGQLGNQNVSPYSDIDLIPIQNDRLNWIFNFGENRPLGYTTAPGIVNRNLTWETATTKNIGANIAFLNNRLQADFDLFERLTTDMVGPSEARPGVLGANVPKENNSNLRTRGWELSLNWKQSLNSGFSYFANVNLYDYKSVVTKYFNPLGTLSTWYEGQELGEIWGYTVYDLFRTQEELDDYLASVDLSHIATRWRTGDVRYEDINNDGKVNNGNNTIDDHGDLSIIGNSEPHWQYGISAGLNYKGFDFSMLLKGVAKKDIYFGRGANMFWGFTHGWWESSLSTNHLDYFRDQPGTKYVGLYEGDANINTDAYWPRPYLNAGQENKNKSNPNTRYLQDASYLRLQNIQLGYNLPQQLTSKLNIQKFRLYFSGENLLTFTKLPNGIDAVALRGWNWGTEYGRLTYGADRVYSLGITITY